MITATGMPTPLITICVIYINKDTTITHAQHIQHHALNDHVQETVREESRVSIVQLFDSRLQTPGYFQNQHLKESVSREC